MKSRVHPTYKTKYHVRNWATYEQGLIRRGDVTIWLSAEAIAGWKAEGIGRPGGQRKYSAAAIETALTLRLIFHLPLRHTEGFVKSVFVMMGVELSTPDHTTLCRRGQSLDIGLRRVRATEAIHLIIDSTGLTMMGEGEWTIAKHGGHGTRRWRKLHLGVDARGVIVAQAVTGDDVRDATAGLDLTDAVDGTIEKVTADTAYDTIAFYDAASARGAAVVVPPKETATIDRRGRGLKGRDRTIEAINRMGRRRWKKVAGYHRQARVENTFFRYKSIVGGALRARSSAGQAVEAIVACNILNEMTEFGKPESYAIGQ